MLFVCVFVGGGGGCKLDLVHQKECVTHSCH